MREGVWYGNNASGLVASLAHPGGNLTGLTLLEPEVSTKRLGLLKEALPQLCRVAVLRDASSSTTLTLLRNCTLRLVQQSGIGPNGR